MRPRMSWDGAELYGLASRCAGSFATRSGCSSIVWPQANFWLVMRPFSGSRQQRSANGNAPPSVLAEVLKFTVAAVVALAALAGIAALILRNISESEAIEQAEQVTEVLARSAVQPAIDSALLANDPAARRRVDRIVRQRVLSPDVVRVKIWTPNGRIVYSDEPRLINSRYQLGDDELDALRTGAVDAELSDLSLPENRFDRGHGELLEVYLPLETPDGRSFLFETYQRFSSVTASGPDLLARFAPALIGALVAIAVLLVPLAWSLARRLRREHSRREALLRRALDASELERRRIAADLHDGILQDLSAAAFSLGALGERTAAAEDGAKTTLEKAAETCRRAVRTLRSMLVEIYPPRLRESGLDSALADLLTPLEERGISTSFTSEPDLELSNAVEGLLFRVGQEALRNVGAHSGARNVEVTTSMNGEGVRLVISDDGQGFSPEQAMARESEGHLGLRLLRDLAADAGARLEIESTPGQGTTVLVEAPSR
jgi:two-component system, NarL family, sensor kinase